MSYTPAQTVDLAGIEPIDIRALTLGEVAYVERRTGVPLTEFGQPGSPMAAPLAAMAGVLLYRTGRWATPEAAQDAAESLTLEQAQTLILTESEDDPAGE